MTCKEIYLVDSVCSVIAADIDAFGLDAGDILARIRRNLAPLRTMSSLKYKLKIAMVSANINHDHDVFEHMNENLKT